MAETNPTLRVEHVSRRFGTRLVIRDISLSIEPGEVVCLLGPSGSGKSTLLRIVAGILEPSSGRVFISGQDQRDVPPYQRDIGFVFQTPAALFPHLNVLDNVAFPFRRGKRAAGGTSWQQDVLRMLQATGLQPHAESSIATLSGGELQRVALARALVYRPSLLLLDEPLSSLDNVLKPQLLDLLLALQAELGTSVLYVTHDEREALQVATRIAVIDNKVIQQYDAVERITRAPESARVAAIVGGWNVLRGAYSPAPEPHVSIGTTFLPCRSLDAEHDTVVDVGIPVEHATLLPTAGDVPQGFHSMAVRVLRRVPRQGGWKYDCAIDALAEPGEPPQRVQCLSSYPVQIEQGTTASLLFPKEAARVFRRDEQYVTSAAAVD